MEERFAYLFRLYLENKCTREELEEFLSYIRRSEHEEEIRRLIKKAYEDIGPVHSTQTYVNEYGHLVLPGSEPEEGSEEPFPVTLEPIAEYRRRRVRRIAGWLSLGILAAAVATWLALTIDQLGNSYTYPGQKNAAATPRITQKNTERSEYKYLLLPDSTQVWLNASSTLEYPDRFTGGERQVTLSGEAYFDVRHADQAPFLIHTGKLVTTVLGTAFNIKAYPGRRNIIVSVSKGKVSISYNSKVVATLAKGQEAKFNSQSSTVEERSIQPAHVAAWQQGNMSYEDETFADIADDLERLYNVKIKIENGQVGSQHISTSFRREIGIAQALQVLCKLTDTELKQKDGYYIIK